MTKSRSIEYAAAYFALLAFDPLLLLLVVNFLDIA